MAGAGEEQQPAHQVVEAIDAVQDRVQARGIARLGRQTLIQLGGRADGGQGIAYLVGDAGQQLAQDGEVFGAAQLLAELLALPTLLPQVAAEVRR